MGTIERYLTTGDEMQVMIPSGRESLSTPVEYCLRRGQRLSHLTRHECPLHERHCDQG